MARANVCFVCFQTRVNWYIEGLPFPEHLAVAWEGGGAPGAGGSGGWSPLPHEFWAQSNEVNSHMNTFKHVLEASLTKTSSYTTTWII